MLTWVKQIRDFVCERIYCLNGGSLESITTGTGIGEIV
jgi:hypothetical protein